MQKNNIKILPFYKNIRCNVTKKKKKKNCVNSRQNTFNSFDRQCVVSRHWNYYNNEYNFYNTILPIQNVSSKNRFPTRRDYPIFLPLYLCGLSDR